MDRQLKVNVKFNDGENEKVVSKSFSKIPIDTEDDNLLTLARTYSSLTSGEFSKAFKITIEELA
ncbi:MAG: hypothetical protein SOZ89_00525 [Peptoniphilaceae bacterium]|nr:hypothetical protein [Peptoniphilaceae bacterium]MDD7383838.1 hypothetical protein [Peptoniphilaceae bacterium]MDY3737585.1 hypothetical protein [Peptoniphilaceae bacterium]